MQNKACEKKQLYMQSGLWLGLFTQEKDRETTVHSSLKHCLNDKSGKGILEIIKKGMENKLENNIMSLYKTMVHPQIEYCMHLWSV